MRRKKPIIALAQIKYFTKSNNNLKKILKYIRLAKEKNADIVCFPESCLHKCEKLSIDHPLIQKIREECKKQQIWCIISEDMIVNDLLKKRPYNMAILIDREGNIKGEYKKIHLYGDKVTPGKKAFVFETDFAKIGIVLCWDLAFPKLFQDLKKEGAEIVFCPAQWWYDVQAHSEKHEVRELKLLQSLILARAFENIYFVALCNPIMDSKYQISYSAIASPSRILSQIMDKEGLIVAEINFNEIKKLTKLYRG